MMGYGGYEGFGWMLGGGLWMWLFWVALIVLIVWGVSSLPGGTRPAAREETPLEILRRRYASGEISREEFEQARQVLA